MLSAATSPAAVSFLCQNEVFSSSNPFPILTNSVKYPFSTFSKNYSLSSSSSSQRPFSSTVKVSVSDGTETIKDEQGISQTPKEESALNSIEEDIRQSRRSDDWKAARAYKEKGSIYEGRVEGFNGGGLLVRFYTILGFLPYPLLSPSHACKEPRKSMQEIAKDLVGSLISVKVTQASEEDRKLIFSEKEAMWSKYSGKIKVGQIFDARVGSVEDYGAFVHLLFPDGYHHITGLVHVSEVSWDLVQDVRDILNEGEKIRAKVIQIDRERLRVTLSIKQLEDDPLLETLDKVIPQEGQSGFDSSTASDDVNIEPLPGLASICEELLKEDGITDVKISRQGFEKRVVSPDLQLWLSNAPAVDNQFTLLARAGRQVQEVHLETTLDQEGIKKALQRVLERLP
ncbi:uncharacterized protein LOC113314230 isoform X1 [Papaver somniferum]|uniref:uncharacterized protein LOC113314230 isoform X1 n=2 Tax=Papaver somniferum TaxID=3469 RepID=UPI000E7023FB|nr:uncharacterized protein LOC113314230 isoform X1 [Papaver somniferum]